MAHMSEGNVIQSIQVIPNFEPKSSKWRNGMLKYPEITDYKIDLVVSAQWPSKRNVVGFSDQLKFKERNRKKAGPRTYELKVPYKEPSPSNGSSFMKLKLYIPQCVWVLSMLLAPFGHKRYRKKKHLAFMHLICVQIKRTIVTGWIRCDNSEFSVNWPPFLSRLVVKNSETISGLTQIRTRFYFA